MMRGGTASCPVCAHAAADPFYSALDVPVTCASVFTSREEALRVPSGSVHLVACGRCGFVFNRAFDQELGQIGAQYESSQGASAHFTAFARGLARDWVARYELAGKPVLEVGSGGGEFLRLLLEAGVASAIGIDPHAASQGHDEDLRIVADTFDARCIDLPGAALVCRHTLEHIADVRAFLAHVRAWARDGRVVLFEVPDSARVFAERAFWDVYYEHCNYFTADTLRLAFELAGFEILRQSRVYGDQYLLLEAVVARTPVSNGGDAISGSNAGGRFGVEVAAAIERCEQRLAALANEGAPLILWQAASKTVGFIAAIRNRDCVAGAVDLSPERQGKFLPGSGLAIHAPEQLRQLRPKHIVLMNPVYLDEVRAQVHALGVSARVQSINDLLSV